jgi:hypothetical protein
VSDEPTPLTLAETGIEKHDDGSEAVNVGPIVAALRYLTEGRGDDRGVDETGAPQADLLSLAFDVISSIILGGRQADYFRQVKLDFDARREGGSSLALAKRAERHTAPTAALKKAGMELQGRVRKLEEATATLIAELEALGGGKKARRTRRASPPARRPRRDVGNQPRGKATPAKKAPAKKAPAKKAPAEKKSRKRAR